MPKDLTEIDAGKWRVLCESVFPSAKSPEAIVLALDYCKARKLDVFKKPVNIVPMYNKTLKKMVETIWPSINEVQVTASRTGKYAGMDEPKWGKDITKTFKGNAKGYDEDGVWQDSKDTEIILTFPEWCSVTVYRMVEGQRCAFTEPVFWEEAYARQGKTELPNSMWAKRTRGQILKVAKAFSIRAAFPEEGEYVAEEMEGKEIAAGGIVIENEMQKIVPSDTDDTKPSSPFKNAAGRNLFCKNVKESILRAKSQDELTEIMLLNKPRFEEMDKSGAEADQLGLDDLRQAYKLEWNKHLKPVIIENEEEEIPPFIKQQMEEEKERLDGINF